MKDMELYDSFIRETNDLLGAPTQKWAYKERDAWKDNGESELVLLRDAAYELGGGANEAVNFTCVTSDAALVPSDEVLLYGPDMKEIKGDVPFARIVILGVKDIDVEQKWAYKERDAWKDNGESELVLLRDAAYELGGGANEAVNFTCVTSDAALVPSDEVLLYGPDMKEIKGDVPFARIVILGVKDIDVEQKDAAYAAIRNIEFVKYHVFPDGYMMRVSPESSREQIRVSKKAVKKGISFYKVGCDFIKQYKKNPNITNVRVIFVTKDVDFKALHATAKKIEDVTKTMNTILEGMPEDLDCASCSFKPVCDEVEGLKELHFGKAAKKEHHA